MFALLAGVAMAVGFPGSVPGVPAMLVCDSSMDRVVRLEDRDGSGLVEPASAGEVTVYYDDSSPGPDLSTPSALALGSRGDLYLLDGGTLDAVLVLEDLDGDGDANDDGEFRVFFDSSSPAPDLRTPNDLGFGSDGWLYVVDDGGRKSTVLALKDIDGDGDALDDGEWRLVYDSTVVQEENPDKPEALVLVDIEALAIDGQGRIYVADATRQSIYILVDMNGDGDTMDSGESMVFYNPGGSHAFGDPQGLTAGAAGEIWATDEDTGLIVRLRDANRDGVARGFDEVFFVVTPNASVAPRDTNDIALSARNELIVLDGSRDQVFVIEDLDGDGVAFSEGEVRPLLGGDERIVGTPSGVVLIENTPDLPGRFRRGDANADGEVGVADARVILAYLFLGTEAPTCADSADVNDDGDISISDPVALLNFLFLGGIPPPPPSRDPGTDPTVDDLTCD